MNNYDSTIEAGRHSGVAPATLASLGLSVVRDDPAFRLQRKLGLIPETGLGIARRALFWSMLAWLPIAVWAAWTGRAIAETGGEPLLAQFGIHVRFLVAIPLLIFAEGGVHATSGRLLLRFVTTGIVPADQVPAMQALIRRLARLRDAVLPWIAILGIVVAGITVSDMFNRVHEIEWATDSRDSSSLGFGAWWFLYVGRPIYLTLLLAWAWRVVLLFLLFGGIARLRLSIVPTHPDRTGGLLFSRAFLRLLLLSSLR